MLLCTTSILIQILSGGLLSTLQNVCIGLGLNEVLVEETSLKRRVSALEHGSYLRDDNCFGFEIGLMLNNNECSSHLKVFISHQKSCFERIITICLDSKFG